MTGIRRGPHMTTMVLLAEIVSTSRQAGVDLTATVHDRCRGRNLAPVNSHPADAIRGGELLRILDSVGDPDQLS